MNEIQAALNSLLPPKRKSTPSGWINLNSPCCHHRGETRDIRMRGGLMLSPTGEFVFSCFNCGFKAGWGQGNLLSKNTRLLLSWLGLPETEISKLAMSAMRLQQPDAIKKKTWSFHLEVKPLPDNCQSIDQWITDGCQDPQLLDIIDYVVNQRGMEWTWYPWHWSPEAGYRDRVILPFYYQSQIVGWTARKITDGKPKYLTDAQPGYVFNLDRQTADRECIIVVEGQFDAVAIDGVAIMHNEPNETQVARINAMAREVIVVPDRDKAGAKMLTVALEHNWSVSIPPWESDIKDVADAVKRYGRLYTLFTIMHYKQSNPIKIQIIKKQMENHD